jgi:hypothetical protein
METLLPEPILQAAPPHNPAANDVIPAHLPVRRLFTRKTEY